MPRNPGLWAGIPLGFGLASVPLQASERRGEKAGGGIMGSIVAARLDFGTAPDLGLKPATAIMASRFETGANKHWVITDLLSCLDRTIVTLLR